MMFIKGKYIIILFLAVNLANAQGLPFELTSSDDTTGKFILDCIPLNDSVPLASGDYIAVIQNGSVVGYLQYEYNQRDTFETYGFENISDSTYNDTFYVWIYKKNKGYCKALATNIQYYILNPGDQGYSRGIRRKITALETRSIKMVPDWDVFCSNMDSALLFSSSIYNNQIWDATLVSDAGLVRNNAGVVYPAQSTLGLHTVKVNSSYCLTGDSVNIDIQNPVVLEAIDYKICSNGEPLFQDSSKNLLNYNYTFINSEQIAIDTSVIEGLGYMTNQTIKYNYLDSFGCAVSQNVALTTINKPLVDTVTEYMCNSTRLKLNYTTLQGDATSSIDLLTLQNSIQVREVMQTSNIQFEITDIFGCINRYNFNVWVKPFEVSDIDYKTEESTCWEYGKINIIRNDIRNGKGNLNFSLTNTLNNKQVTDFNKVPEGVYNISVSDSRNCIAVFNRDIYVLKDCLKDYPVFTPNNDGVEDDYFIPYQGSVEIYNRSGNIIRKLDTPAYWDGKDENGENVSMGTYVAVTNEGKSVEITIIK